MLLPKDFSLTGDEAEEVVVPPPVSSSAAGASGTASAAAASYLAARAATASSSSSVSAAAATRTTSETTTPRPLPRSQPIEAQAIVRSRPLTQGEIQQDLLEIRVLGYSLICDLNTGKLTATLVPQPAPSLNATRNLG